MKITTDVLVQPIYGLQPPETGFDSVDGCDGGSGGCGTCSVSGELLFTYAISD